MSDRIVEARELAAIAKQSREASGKSQTEAARELRVSGPTMFQAEEVPEKSLHKLRKQIIERYSEYEVVGPVYVIRRKLLTRQSDTILSPP